ncbi:hypothetical protein PFISCL1PPCAC_7600, partial [Pristionchus fissidentatus]
LQYAPPPRPPLRCLSRLSGLRPRQPLRRQQEPLRRRSHWLRDHLPSGGRRHPLRPLLRRQLCQLRRPVPQNLPHLLRRAVRGREPSVLRVEYGFLHQSLLFGRAALGHVQKEVRTVPVRREEENKKEKNMLMYKLRR